MNRARAARYVGLSEPMLDRYVAPFIRRVREAAGHDYAFDPHSRWYVSGPDSRFYAPRPLLNLWLKHTETDEWPCPCDLCVPDGPRQRAHIPGAVRRAVYERDGWACLYCGAEAALSLDHVVPWSLGGSDDESNLQTLCLPCNVRKGARAGVA